MASPSSSNPSSSRSNSARASAPTDLPTLLPHGKHRGKPGMTLSRPFTLAGTRSRAHLHLVSSTVSKCHAAIVHDNGRVYVRDLCSRTHVYVNGRVIRDMELSDGDLVQIGSFTFKLSLPTSGGDAPTLPPGQLEESNNGGGILPLDGRTTVIGRRPGCDLQIDDESVSTIHAIIFELDGLRYVRDLGSRTGTFINGIAAHQQPLNFNDRLRVGPREFIYRKAPEGTGSFEDINELEDLVGTARLGHDELLSFTADSKRTVAEPGIPVQEGESTLPAAEQYVGANGHAPVGQEIGLEAADYEQADAAYTADAGAVPTDADLIALSSEEDDTIPFAPEVPRAAATPVVAPIPEPTPEPIDLDADHDAISTANDTVGLPAAPRKPAPLPTVSPLVEDLSAQTVAQPAIEEVDFGDLNTAAKAPDVAGDEASLDDVLDGLDLDAQTPAPAPVKVPSPAVPVVPAKPPVAPPLPSGKMSANAAPAKPDESQAFPEMDDLGMSAHVIGVMPAQWASGPEATPLAVGPADAEPASYQPATPSEDLLAPSEADEGPLPSADEWTPPAAEQADDHFFDDLDSLEQPQEAPQGEATLEPSMEPETEAGYTRGGEAGLDLYTEASDTFAGLTEFGDEQLADSASVDNTTAAGEALSSEPAPGPQVELTEVTPADVGSGLDFLDESAAKSAASAMAETPAEQNIPPVAPPMPAAAPAIAASAVTAAGAAAAIPSVAAEAPAKKSIWSRFFGRKQAAPTPPTPPKTVAPPAPQVHHPATADSDVDADYLDLPSELTETTPEDSTQQLANGVDLTWPPKSGGVADGAAADEAAEALRAEPTDFDALEAELTGGVAAPQPDGESTIPTGDVALPADSFDIPPAAQNAETTRSESVEVRADLPQLGASESTEAVPTGRPYIGVAEITLSGLGTHGAQMVLSGAGPVEQMWGLQAAPANFAGEPAPGDAVMGASASSDTLSATPISDPSTGTSASISTDAESLPEDFFDDVLDTTSPEQSAAAEPATSAGPAPQADTPATLTESTSVAGINSATVGGVSGAAPLSFMESDGGSFLGGMPLPLNTPRTQANAPRAGRPRLPFADRPVTFDTRAEVLAEVVAVDDTSVPMFGTAFSADANNASAMTPMRSDLIPASLDADADFGAVAAENIPLAEAVMPVSAAAMVDGLGEIPPADPTQSSQDSAQQAPAEPSHVPEAWQNNAWAAGGELPGSATSIALALDAPAPREPEAVEDAASNVDLEQPAPPQAQPDESAEAFADLQDLLQEEPNHALVAPDAASAEGQTTLSDDSFADPLNDLEGSPADQPEVTQETWAVPVAEVESNEPPAPAVSEAGVVVDEFEPETGELNADTEAGAIEPRDETELAIEAPLEWAATPAEDSIEEAVPLAEASSEVSVGSTDTNETLATNEPVADFVAAIEGETRFPSNEGFNIVEMASAAEPAAVERETTAFSGGPIAGNPVAATEADVDVDLEDLLSEIPQEPAPASTEERLEQPVESVTQVSDDFALVPAEPVTEAAVEDAADQHVELSPETIEAASADVLQNEPAPAAIELVTAPVDASAGVSDSGTSAVAIEPELIDVHVEPHPHVGPLPTHHGDEPHVATAELIGEEQSQQAAATGGDETPFVAEHVDSPDGLLLPLHLPEPQEAELDSLDAWTPDAADVAATLGEPAMAAAEPVIEESQSTESTPPTGVEESETLSWVEPPAPAGEASESIALVDPVLPPDIGTTTVVESQASVPVESTGADEAAVEPEPLPGATAESTIDVAADAVEDLSPASGEATAVESTMSASPDANVFELDAPELGVEDTTDLFEKPAAAAHDEGDVAISVVAPDAIDAASETIDVQPEPSEASLEDLDLIFEPASVEDTELAANTTETGVEAATEPTVVPVNAEPIAADLFEPEAETSDALSHADLSDTAVYTSTALSPTDLTETDLLSDQFTAATPPENRVDVEAKPLEPSAESTIPLGPPVTGAGPELTPIEPTHIESSTVEAETTQAFDLPPLFDEPAVEEPAADVAIEPLPSVEPVAPTPPDAAPVVVAPGVVAVGAILGAAAGTAAAKKPATKPVSAAKKAAAAKPAAPKAATAARSKPLAKAAAPKTTVKKPAAGAVPAPEAGVPLARKLEKPAAPRRVIAAKPASRPLNAGFRPPVGAAGAPAAGRALGANAGTRQASAPVPPRDPFTNTGDFVQPAGPARRGHKRLILILIAVLLTAAAIVAIWLLWKPPSTVQGRLQFHGLENPALSSDSRQAFMHEQIARLGDHTLIATAQDDVLNKGMSLGILGGSKEETLHLSEALANAKWDERAGVLAIDYPGMKEPADRDRMLALLRAAKQRFDAQKPAMGDEAVQKKARREAAELAAELARIVASREQAQKMIDEAPERMAEVERLTKKLSELEAETSAMPQKIRGLEREVARLEKMPTANALAANAQDAELKRLTDQLKSLNESLAAATETSNASTGDAKDLLDNAQKQFDMQVTAARDAAAGNIVLAAYLDKLAALQSELRKHNEELGQQQKDQRDMLDRLRGRLKDETTARIQRAWDADPQLKALLTRRAVAERQFNVASSAKLPEAAKLQAELKELDEQTEALRSLIASKDEYDPLTKQFLTFLDDSLKLMDQSRQRNERRLQELFNAFAGAKPDMDKLPADQQAKAKALDKAYDELASTRARYQAALAQSNGRAEEAVRQLTQQVAAQEARVEARKRELAEARAADGGEPAPELAMGEPERLAAIEARRKELEEARHAAAKLETDWIATSAALRQARADVAQAEAAKTQIERLDAQRTAANNKLHAVNEQLAESTGDPRAAISIAEVDSRSAQISTGEDKRWQYTSLAAVGGLFLTFMALAASRSPGVYIPPMQSYAADEYEVVEEEEAAPANADAFSISTRRAS